MSIPQMKDEIIITIKIKIINKNNSFKIKMSKISHLVWKPFPSFLKKEKINVLQITIATKIYEILKNLLHVNIANLIS